MLERMRNGSWSIQAQFLLYSAALLIPALIFSGLMIVRSASLERAAMEGEIDNVVRALATAIDRDLSATTTTLNALASSPALTDGDIKAFYNQAIAVQEASGDHIVLTNRVGKQILNTHAPWGEELPRVSGDDWKDVVESGKARVSDVSRGEGGGDQPTFSISVPVKRGAKTIYVLSASIAPERILDIFQRAELDAGWVATVTDRTGRRRRPLEGPSEARRRGAAEGPPRAAAKRPPDRGDPTDADGEPVLRASAYSQQSEWLVSTSVPEAIANRPIVHSWFLVATLAFSFALLSALLAYFFGRKFSDPVRALVEGALDLGRGETVAPIRSSIPRCVRLAKLWLRRARHVSEWNARCAKARIACGWRWPPLTRGSGIGIQKAACSHGTSACAHCGGSGLTIRSPSTSSSRRSIRSIAK